MKLAVPSSIIAVLVAVPAVVRSEQSESGVLAITAHQDHGLSLANAWTAEVNKHSLTIIRPGKKKRVRRLERRELESVRQTIEGARFDSVSPRLGLKGICDDCSRCFLIVDTGRGPHRVDRIAESALEAAPVVTEEDRRFRVVWDAIKSVAGVQGVPDACW